MHGGQRYNRKAGGVRPCCQVNILQHKLKYILAKKYTDVTEVPLAYLRVLAYLRCREI